jgi:hypothetical protein
MLVWNLRFGWQICSRALTCTMAETAKIIPITSATTRAMQGYNELDVPRNLWAPNTGSCGTTATRKYAMLQQEFPEKNRNILYCWLMIALAGKAIGG